MADENERHAGRILERVVQSTASLETRQMAASLVSDLVQHEMRNRNTP
jgi:hypothetical protein